MNKACPLRLTATAGTKLVGTQFLVSCHNLPPKKRFTTQAFCPSLSLAGSSFRSLSNIPYCCLQKKPGPCFSPSVVDRSPKPTKHYRLGKHYPTNYLILSQLISNRRAFNIYSVFSRVTFSLKKRDGIIPKLEVDNKLITHPYAMVLTIRLACIKADSQPSLWAGIKLTLYKTTMSCYYSCEKLRCLESLQLPT